MFLINDLKAYLYVMQICDYDEYTFESSRYDREYIVLSLQIGQSFQSDSCKAEPIGWYDRFLT